MNRRDFLTGLGAIPLLVVTSAVSVNMKSPAPVERRETAHRKPTTFEEAMKFASVEYDGISREYLYRASGL